MPPKIVSKLLVLIFLAPIATPAFAEWVPPPHPEPRAILQEARNDAENGQYEDALAKHVWFHRNALTYRRALYGVRLSYALNDWYDLGKKYPPALNKLREFRNQASRDVKIGDNVRESFHDFKSINRALGEEILTKDLFIWLDTHDVVSAKRVFDIAQPALVKEKEYSLCGKYIDSHGSFKQSMRILQAYRNFARDPTFGPDPTEIGNKIFTNRVTTLIALMVINNRKAGAQKIAKEAIKKLKIDTFKNELKEALDGKVPDPYP